MMGIRSVRWILLLGLKEVDAWFSILEMGHVMLLIGRWVTAELRLLILGSWGRDFMNFLLILLIPFFVESFPCRASHPTKRLLEKNLIIIGLS